MWPLISSAEDLLGVRLALLGRVGELDAAGLHAAAGEHLRLDHDRTADVGRDLLGALGVGGEAAAGDGNALALEDLPALVLEEPHGGAGTLAGEAVRAYGGFEAHFAPTRPPVDACCPRGACCRGGRSRHPPSVARRSRSSPSNVEPLATLPVPHPIGARFRDGLMYVTTTEGLTVYDVTDPGAAGAGRRAGAAALRERGRGPRRRHPAGLERPERGRRGAVRDRHLEPAACRC